MLKESKTNILIAEPSFIIYEGLYNILSRSGGYHYNIVKVEEFSEIEKINFQSPADLILINPCLIQNQLKMFHNIKKELNAAQWVGIIYSFFDQHLISQFDGIITVNDTPEHIVNTVQKLLSIDQSHSEQQASQTETLSDREIEVLKLLVAGNSNKEIADKLFISTHTVITHRKNISQKTGIKSVSGLTIYAVVNNIITLDNYTE
jgi:DNA-binding NarL/FixJ family response regulator